MIAVENLCLRIGALQLERLSFNLATGSYGVLMGKTGSGKTTLLEAICGLRKLQAGSIRLLDREVAHLKPAERNIGYVPQDRALFPMLTVRQHLAFGLVVRRWPRPRIDERVAELAELLGIAALLERRPHGLSGGEGQRVALGRALAFAPRILLLDEPLSALDEDTRGEMVLLLKRIQREVGVTTLHVTHSQAEARQLATHVLLLRDGRLDEIDLPTNGAVLDDDRITTLPKSLS